MSGCCDHETPDAAEPKEGRDLTLIALPTFPFIQSLQLYQTWFDSGESPVRTANLPQEALEIPYRLAAILNAPAGLPALTQATSLPQRCQRLMLSLTPLYGRLINRGRIMRRARLCAPWLQHAQRAARVLQVCARLTTGSPPPLALCGKK